MVNLSGRLKMFFLLTSGLKARTFILEDNQRFARMLFLAAIAHLALFISLDLNLTPFSSSEVPLTKMMSTLLEVTLNPESNQISPEIALNIAPQNHASSTLFAPPISINQAAPRPSEPVPTKDPNGVLLSAMPELESLPAPKLPRTPSEPMLRKRTISAASHESKDAAYLARWQSYVEQYGNDHYPEHALKDNLKGNLRLLVALRKDGTLHGVSIRHSSGSPVLDNAAIEIVKQAAPFEPLPPEIAQDIEILEIIRTWQFRGKLSTSS